MTDEGPNGVVEQQKGKTRGTSSTEAQAQAQAQAQAAPSSGEPSPEQAATEYAQILNLLNLAGVQTSFQAASDLCKKPPQWCLPDVSCTARVTLGTQAMEQFKENRKICDRNYSTSN